MFFEVMLGRGVGGLDGVLTYYFDDSLASGTIVEVPVGKMTVPGVIVKKVVQPSFKCKKIVRILYSKPLPWHLIETAKWISEYYQAPLSACLGMMLPVGVLKKCRTRPNKTEQEDGLFLDGSCRTLSSPTSLTLSGGPPPGPSPVHGNTSSLKVRNVSLSRATTPASTFANIQLNPAQKMAIEGLQKGLGATKVLFGVTGSGKTNIYLHEALNGLKRQKSIILLVPEIALTGQLVQVFQDVFGDMVTVLHSKQTEAERHLIFESLLLSNGPRIVVGPRSALFAPLVDLGLIIIDEEHESTYYQENSPKYSAIRVASHMAKVLKCSCVLGSATPAISDYYLAKQCNSLVVLKEKAKKDAKKADIRIIDFKERESFSRNKYFSNQLLQAIKNNLSEGRQTLIFHNRRGSAPLTICEDCGEEIVCPRCFLPLTLHADKYEMVCHTCGYSSRVPGSCPKCGGISLIHKGFGTKLLETELKKLFPKASIKRFDADNKKGEGLEAVYTAVKEGQVDILVGTQTLAKGLDLPKLATVGVVQADAGLSLPDYVAEERVFQLLTQVIGRVGRGHTDKAEVFIQTFRPEHPVLKYATEENYEAFAEYLLKKRRKAGFPPYKYVAKISVTLKTEALVIKKVRDLAIKLSKEPGLLVSPPMPEFHERTSRGYTWQIVVRAASRRSLVKVCEGLEKNIKATLDPPSLL